MQHRTISGKIVYTSRLPERLGEVRGRETFTFSVHGDGKRTFCAHCEIEDPAPTVMRDVVYMIDENDMPMHLLVNLTVGDRFMGGGMMLVRDGHVECESVSPSLGRLSQRVKIVGAYDGFGTHPIQGDAYITKKMDVAQGPHQRALRNFLPSPDHRGATPPLIADVTIDLAYLGEDTVTVAAGTFDCRRFRFSDDAGGMATDKGGHPPYDLWVTADDDAIFVQGGVGGYMQTWYELVELVR